MTLWPLTACAAPDRPASAPGHEAKTVVGPEYSCGLPKIIMV